MSINNMKGIWKYKKKLPEIKSDCQLTLGEGNTSLLHLDGVFFKCEFENPSGSVKDRGMAYQISKVYEKGIRKAVISSSGNAAISAASYCQLAHIDLTVFISPLIVKEKLDILKTYGFKIIETVKPVSQAFKFAKLHRAYNLRQSQDDSSLFGYSTIAYEITEIEPAIDAVFVPLSSGTTMAGLYQGFQNSGKMPAFHLVQTEKVCSLARNFDSDYQPQHESLADGIVARFTPRKAEILKIIKQTAGNGWVICDSLLMSAANYLQEKKLDCSYDGALAYAGYLKSVSKGLNYDKPLCLLTGIRR